jgi:Uma2 family endonuclease
MHEPLKALARDAWIGQPMSREQYRLLEERDPQKWEYLGGRAYLWTGYDTIDPVTGQAGASQAHVDIQSNVVEQLRAAARVRGCRAYGSEMRFYYDPAGGRYYYPDAIVSCETPKEIDSVAAMVAPCTLIEIVSRSNRIGGPVLFATKLQRYLATRSVETVLVVEQDTRLVHVYARQPDGTMPPEPQPLTSGSIPLRPCLDIELSLDDVYRDVAESMP